MARCRNSFLRLLLERVQHINHHGEFDGVDRTIGIAAKIVYYFKHATAAEPLERFGGRMFGPLLGTIERFAHHCAHLAGK